MLTWYDVDQVTEELIMALFSQIGPVKGCKIIREPGRENQVTRTFWEIFFLRQRPVLLCGVCASSGRKCGYYRNEQAPLHGQRDEGAVTEKDLVLSFSYMAFQVNWATSPGGTPKQDTSLHHHIFVGDLSPEIDTETLRNAFAPFGEISDCRVVRNHCWFLKCEFL